MPRARFYEDGTGSKFMKMGSTQGQLVDAGGRPISKIPKPRGLYSRGSNGLAREAGLKKFAAADNALTSPEVRNPLLNIVNFFLPYNYRVLAQWIRYYDKFHPTVGNCLDMHGSFPISKFDLIFEEGGDSQTVRNTYENCVDSCDLFNKMLEISREYELLGEVYPYLHWNDDWGFFDSLILLNPDFIHVDMHPLAFGKDPIIKLEPDELLKVIATSTNPEDIEIRNDMDPMVVAAVLTEQNVRLDPFSVTQIARKSSPYEPRGTSIVLRAIKDLLYEDKIREAQYAISDALITPKLIWKLGDPDHHYMPNDQELHEFRQLLEAQAHDPLGAIVTHYGLQLDVVGYNGQILPLLPEFEFVQDRILQALYCSKEIMHGSGPAFSNVSIAMEILEGRYMAKREKLEEFVKKKIFSKIAYLNGFYEPRPTHMGDGAGVAPAVIPSKQDRRLNIPKLEWKQKLSLVEDTVRQQAIIALRNTMNTNGVPGVSLKTVYKLLGISQQEEFDAIKKESVILKEMAEMYPSNSPLGGALGAPAAKPSSQPSEKPSQMELNGIPAKAPGGTGGGAGSPEYKEKQYKPPTGASLKKRESWQDSELLKRAQKAGKGMVPTMEAPPVSFLGKEGRLAKLEEILESTEKEFES